MANSLYEQAFDYISKQKSNSGNKTRRIKSHNNTTSYQKKKKKEEDNIYSRFKNWAKEQENELIDVQKRNAKKHQEVKEKNNIINKQNKQIYSKYLKDDMPEYYKERSENPTQDDIRQIRSYYNAVNKKDDVEKNTLNTIKNTPKREVEQNKYSSYDSDEQKRILKEKEQRALILSYQLTSLNTPTGSKDTVLNKQIDKNKIQEELNSVNNDIAILKKNKDGAWYKNQEETLSDTPDEVLKLLIEKNQNPLEFKRNKEINNTLYDIGYTKEQVKDLDTYIDYALDKESTLIDVENAKQMAKEAPVLTSVGSVPLNLTSGLGVIEGLRAELTDTPINIYDETWSYVKI